MRPRVETPLAPYNKAEAGATQQNIGFIENLLKEVGGERYPGPIDDEGPSDPGMSSVIEMFYAATPPKIFDAAIARLKTLLENED